jgi:flagellar hook protein FlgE
MALTSFYTALTGLNNNSLAINIVGDNLANMNTTAFKTSKASFAELLAGLSGTSSNGNPISFGLGSSLNGVTRLTSQGTITYTGRSTDAAINGNGFFVVSTDGGHGFTRAGRLEFDKEGNLLSSDGFKILGYMAVDGEIDSSSGLVPIETNKGQSIPARATENFSLAVNLDAAAVDGSSFMSAVQVYDSLGMVNTIGIEFTKNSAGNWSWSATLPATATGGAVDDPPVVIGSGNLTFDNRGELQSPTDNPILSITGLANGAADMDIVFNLYDDAGNSFLTNYGSPSSISSTIQDGNGASILKDILIDSSGVIGGMLENGQVIPIAQLAIADFPNIEGLQKYVGSTFVAFTSSGDPSIGIAGTGGRGTIVGSSLEQSNVDMAQEFINLMVAQRAYQANSRVITTTDELYQESLNLKR